MATKSKRPRDTNQLAKFITDVATGEVELPKTDEGKDPAAVALGRKGGLKGGKARASMLSADQRAKIAKLAAQARWKRSR
ncbi:histone H1 [Steroidobacter denitrificans]|uniref:Histone H1 n=1 Tax=Steroidobacter denitrificans TaxID=465721 RepID=A0A127FE55_STEDE|nr:histone H1 [Steroidobacter denitrificans]AMN48085.1 histone H1 [Steroidobacter denitrificans]